MAAPGAKTFRPRPGGSETALTRFEPPPSELEQLTLLLTQTQQRYPHQDLSEAAEMYLADYAVLMHRYGLPRVRQALAEIRVAPGYKFFPQPSETAEVVEETMRKTAAAERAEHPWIPCAQCRDTSGMAPIYDVERGWVIAMKPCPCRAAWKAEEQERAANSGAA